MTTAQDIIETYSARGLKIATAESCTGGLIIGALTDIAGSSTVIDRGFITYSNEAKMQMLGVSPSSLEAFGAVSEQVAREMAEGALKNSDADITIAVTGIAGPGGGSDEKPVGLVYMALASKDQTKAYELLLGADNSRAEIRRLTVERSLKELKNFIDS